MGQESSDSIDSRPADSFVKSQIRYAQACLDLAKTDLKIAMQSAASYSPVAIQRRQNAVKVAEELLRVANLPANESDAVPVHLRYAQEKATLAKRTYERALESNKKNMVYNDLQLEQLRLKAEVAESRLQVWSHPAKILTYLDHIHWEIDRLGEAIIDLQQRQDKFDSR